MKAEFAADLNNLSNRMAQLENSLDAKIDSLVSSYLTRNGIWNGAKQDFNYNITLNKNINFSRESITTARSSDGYSIFKSYGSGSHSGFPFTVSMSVQYTGYQKYFYGIFYKFITTNKSGLLVFDFTAEGTSDTYNEIYIRVASWQNSSRPGLTGMAGLMLLSGNQYNPNNANAKIIASGLTGYGSTAYSIGSNSSGVVYYGVSGTTGVPMDSLYLPFPFGTSQLMGFVEKGEELSLVYGLSGFSAFYQTTSWTVNYEGGFKITGMNARIY